MHMTEQIMWTKDQAQMSSTQDGLATKRGLYRTPLSWSKYHSPGIAFNCVSLETRICKHNRNESFSKQI